MSLRDAALLGGFPLLGALRFAKCFLACAFFVGSFLFALLSPRRLLAFPVATFLQDRLLATRTLPLELELLVLFLSERVVPFLFRAERLVALALLAGELLGFLALLARELLGFFALLPSELLGFFALLAGELLGFLALLARELLGFFALLPSEFLGFFTLQAGELLLAVAGLLGLGQLFRASAR